MTLAMSRRSVSGARDAFAEMADLWIEGIAAPHDAGCSCGGLFMPTIAAADIERDFLGFLAGKYRDIEELRALVAERSAAQRGEAFENWLARLGEAPLSSEGRERLLADLRTFLESFGGRGRSRFGVCY
jgi:hypothetical protein